MVFEIENGIHSPIRYQMDAREQLQAFLSMEKLSLELLAIYHSHPAGPDHPSPIDIDEFAYPGTPYLIWYPEATDWACRAFQLTDSGYREVPIIIGDE